MAQNIKLDFVIVEHSLLKPFTIKEAIIFKAICIKAKGKKLNEFPYTQNQIPKLTGISKNTVIEALKKFQDLELINILDNHKIHLSSNNIDEVLLQLDNDYIREEEKYRNGLTPVNVKYIHFNFELCKKLKLNEIQYSVLHTYYILSKKYGYAFIGKSYFIRNFRIKERQFKNIKSKLIKDGYIYKRDKSEMIYLSQTTIDMFKNCIIEKVS